MQKMKFISLILTALLVFSVVGLCAVFAETQPAETIPDVSEPVFTQPVDSEPTESMNTDNTDNTDSTDYTDPTGTDDTDPSEETERPTEFSEPSTFSDYVSPAPIYTPGDQDYEKQDWQNLSLNVSDSDGPGSFAGIKNDRSTKDRINHWWLIGAILFGCLSLAAITFAVLYRPAGVPAHQSKKPVPQRKDEKMVDISTRNTRNASSKNRVSGYERKYSDDYNDGF